MKVRRRPTPPPTRDIPGAKSYPGGLFGLDRETGVVIGIDQSLTGFAICAMSLDGERYYCWLYGSKELGIRRLSDIETFLFRALEVITSYTEVHYITMEGYARERKNGREEAGELAAIVKRTLCEFFGWDRQVAYPTIVAPTALKKFTLGNGKAPKQRMLLGCFKKWGVEFDNDNPCDAYSLARVAQAVTSGAASLKYEQEVLDNLREHTEWSPLPLRSQPPPELTCPTPSPTRAPGRTKTSSESEGTPASRTSRRPSATRSTTARSSSSGRSVRARSTRPSRRSR